MKLLFIYSPTELVIKKAKPGYKFQNKNINPWKQNFICTVKYMLVTLTCLA